MDGSHELQSANPWSTTDFLSGIELGSPQNGLLVARRCGLPLDQDRLQAGSSTMQGKVMKSKSVKMMKLLQELSQIAGDIEQIELEIHRHLLDRETADLLHVNILEARLKKVDGLLNHFSDVMACKDELLGRLQSTTTDNSLKIEAPYQRHVCELLTSMGTAITEMPAHCRRLHWARELSTKKAEVEERLSGGVQSLVQCKAVYQRCQGLHSNHTAGGP